MKFIINADDYGRSHSINVAVKEAFNQLIVTNTTVMMNMKYAEEGFELASTNGFSDKVGLHLNLTEGLPLSLISRKDASTEYLFRDFLSSYKSKFFLSKKQLYLCEVELRAQIERFIDLGFTQMHLDSHHHIHTYPSLINLVLNLAKEYKFESIRLPKNYGKLSNNIIKSSFKFYMQKMFCDKFLNGLLSSDFFTSLEEFQVEDNNSYSQNIIIELMTHPQIENNELKDLVFGYNKPGLPIKCLKENIGVENLISYSDKLFFNENSTY